MRVIQVIEAIDSQAGSLELLLSGLFAALRGRDVESPVVRLNTKPLGESREAGPTALAAIPFDPRTAAGLFKNADLMHLHGWSGQAARRAAALARETGTPYVISPCGALSNKRHVRPPWRERLRAWFSDKALLRHAAAITAINEEEQCDLRAQELNEAVTLLPYGLTFSDYDGAVESTDIPEAKANGHRLLMLGPIHPAAGYVPFLRALAEVGTPTDEWKLVLAGPQSGEWRQMLEAAVRRKGGADRMRIAPAADLSAQRAWLAGSTILADPSLRIQGPVSILQAVASGVPVLASTCVAPPGMEEVIRVCRPRREDFKQALHEMLELSAQELAAMADAARKLGRSLLDWPVLSQRYVDFYRRLI